jgi:hypothetical protein
LLLLRQLLLWLAEALLLLPSWQRLPLLLPPLPLPLLLLPLLLLLLLLIRNSDRPCCQLQAAFAIDTTVMLFAPLSLLHHTETMAVLLPADCCHCCWCDAAAASSTMLIIVILRFDLKLLLLLPPAPLSLHMLTLTEGSRQRTGAVKGPMKGSRTDVGKLCESYTCVVLVSTMLWCFVALLHAVAHRIAVPLAA